MPRIRLPWIAAALMAAAPAFSQELAHGYAGLAGGQSRTGHELVTNRQATIVDATIESSAFDATDTGWKVFAGWRFNDYLALEASYADLGRSRLVTNTVSVDLLPGSIDLRRKTTAFGLDAVVSAPVGTRFAVFGRAGAARARAQEVESLEGGIVFTNGPSDERERSATFDETVAHFGRQTGHLHADVDHWNADLRLLLSRNRQGCNQAEHNRGEEEQRRQRRLDRGAG